jgi:hypothetical protein
VLDDLSMFERPIGKTLRSLRLRSLLSRFCLT